MKRRGPENREVASIPMSTVTNEQRRWTQAELMAEGRRRFGEDPLKWVFVCPNCGDEASLQDFQDAIGDVARAGQECIGRVLGALEKPTATNTRGCDWTAYGLFAGPWTVLLPADGFKPEREARSFRFASSSATTPPTAS